MLLQLAQALPHLASQSPRQLSAWVAAVVASVRLLPCLPQLDAQLKQHDSSLNGAEQLSSALLEFVLLHAASRDLHPSTCTAPLPVGDAFSWGSVPEQAWELHTALCRLIAALADPAAPLRLPEEHLSPDRWLGLLHSLDKQLRDIVWVQQLWLGSQAPELPSFLEQAPG